MASGGRGRARSVRLLATALIVALCAFTVISLVVIFLARIEATSAMHALRRSVLPATTKADELESVYIDEQDSLRGYLLTGGHHYLEAYSADGRRAVALDAKLETLLVSDSTALSDLRSVEHAHDAWATGSAEPAIAVRQSASAVPSSWTSTVAAEQRAFGVVHQRLAALRSRTQSLSAVQVDRLASARKTADVVTVVALILAAVVALLAVPVLRRILTGPLDRLVRQVQRVAGGDSELAIVPEGAAELVTLAGATEQMRQSLVARSEALVDAQRGLTLRAERDRLAEDLHDLSIQRMYALGISLISLSKRHPAIAPAVERLVEEIDELIRELRAIIFGLDLHGKGGLRRGLDQVLHEASQSLGFVPALELRGEADAALVDELVPEVLAVLREALSNVARHAGASAADVVISVEGQSLLVVVADNGVGPGTPRQGGLGLGNIRARADRLGGTAALASRPGGGSALTWMVPLGNGGPAPSAEDPPSSTAAQPA